MEGERIQEIASEPEDVQLPLSMRLLGYLINLSHSWTYRKDGTVNRKLQYFLDLKVQASSKPVNGISTKDVVVDATNGVWVRIFTPTQERETSKDKTEDDSSDRKFEKKLPVLIYYHGGGFIASYSPDSGHFDKLCREIAKVSEAVVVSADYRRAPECPYPAAYDDCYKVLEWLRSPHSRSELPAASDISQCFLLGDSAGGNIVHFMGCKAAENDLSPVKVRGMVELQPFFGGEELDSAEINVNGLFASVEFCHWAWKAFLPGKNRDHPACNVFGPNSPDISELPLPPIFVAIGSHDSLKDRDANYVKKLQEMGKDVTVHNYAGACHGFYILGPTKLAAKVIADVCDFIRSHAL